MPKLKYKKVGPSEFETLCRYCRAVLLFAWGDPVHLFFDGDNQVTGVCCTPCFREHGHKDGAVLAGIWKK